MNWILTWISVPAFALEGTKTFPILPAAKGVARVRRSSEVSAGKSMMEVGEGSVVLSAAVGSSIEWEYWGVEWWG